MVLTAAAAATGTLTASVAPSSALSAAVAALGTLTAADGPGPGLNVVQDQALAAVFDQAGDPLI